MLDHDGNLIDFRRENISLVILLLFFRVLNDFNFLLLSLFSFFIVILLNRLFVRINLAFLLIGFLQELLGEARAVGRVPRVVQVWRGGVAA